MQKYGYEVDEASYQMGYIGCYSEMVAAKLTKIALSNPIRPQDVEAVEKAAQYLTDSYGISYYLDRQPKQAAEGQAVFVLYGDPAQLTAYLKAKEQE